MTPDCTEAFVLRLTPFGEADRVVELFTREFGRVSAMARNARRSRRRFGATLDYFHRLEARVRRRRTGLWNLESVELVSRCSAPGESLEAFTAASLVLEVARLGSREGDPDPAFFALVASTLAALDRGADPVSLAGVFQIRALAVLGYGWAVDRCPHCGVAIGGAARIGPGCEVLCDGCAGPGAGVLSAGVVRTLAAAAGLPLDRLGALRIAEPVRAGLAPLLDQALESALGRRVWSGDLGSEQVGAANGER